MAKKTYTILIGSFSVGTPKKPEIASVGDTITMDEVEAQKFVDAGELVIGEKKVSKSAAKSRTEIEAIARADKADADLATANASIARFEGVLEALRKDHDEAVTAAEAFVDAAIKAAEDEATNENAE